MTKHIGALTLGLQVSDGRVGNLEGTLRVIVSRTSSKSMDVRHLILSFNALVLNVRIKHGFWFIHNITPLTF